MSIPFYGNLDLNGNEIQNYKIQNLSSPPDNPISGQQYYNNVDNKLYYYNGTTWVEGGGNTGSSDGLLVGTIIEWPSDTIPESYLLCDGSEVSRTEYKDLFDVIGTSFGDGDGSTTFNLPDKRGKFGIGKDSNQSGYNTIGKTGGSFKRTLTLGNIPSHTHTFTANAHTHTVASHTHSIPAHAHGLNSHKHSFSATSSSDSHSHSISITTSSDSHTHNIGMDFDGAGGSSRWTVHQDGTSGAGDTAKTSSDSHTHTVKGNTGSDSHSHTVSGTTGASSGNTANSSALTSGTATPATNSVTVTGTIGSTGSGDEVDVTNPYIALNYIIKAKGTQSGSGGSGGSGDGQIALNQAYVVIDNVINENTDYTIPLNYTVGANDLEVFYCGNKLQKDMDYIEIGSSNSTSNKIQFKTPIGDLDMSGISGFENFKETLQFTVTGKSNYYVTEQVDASSLLQSNWKLNEHSQIYKINNIVTISLCVKEGEDTLVLILPEHFRPKSLMFFPATAVQDTAGNHYCNVTVDGKLFIPSANVGKLIMMNFNYLID